MMPGILHLTILLIMVIAQGYSFDAAGQNARKRSALDVVTEAIQNPESPEAIDAYLRLQQDVGNGYYVVDGDERFTRDQVIEHLRDLKRTRDARKKRNISDNAAELKVAYDSNGALSYWKTESDRTLTFSLDYQSFGARNRRAAEQVLGHVKAAAGEWANSCPECKIAFVFVPPEHAGRGFEKVVFVVRYAAPSGALVAEAFYPYDYLATKQTRSLLIYPAYFKTRYEKVGIMRHELGHILGYRHEHIGVPGCAYENNRWRALTQRDSNSVMHYPCGGGGNPRFPLSKKDMEAHRCLYLKGAPCPVTQ